MQIQNILSAYSELRERGVRDPLVCRLKTPDTGSIGWIFRDKSMQGKNLQTGEKFRICFQEAGEIQIEWKPIFDTAVIGDRDTKHYAWWFFNQNPKVCGGTHQTLDSFRGDAAAWHLQAKDFYMVRCGSYLSEGWRLFRQPSDHAQAWVRDKELFLVPDEVRKSVINLMSGPDRRGEWYTIRRVFSEGSKEQ